MNRTHDNEYDVYCPGCSGEQGEGAEGQDDRLLCEQEADSQRIRGQQQREPTPHPPRQGGNSLQGWEHRRRMETEAKAKVVALVFNFLPR